nr:MAG TPA: hypothetical protein [Caudoviricetes sp.]
MFLVNVEIIIPHRASAYSISIPSTSFWMLD